MRKERCDGAKPCRRCTTRRVEAACVYTPLTASRRAVQTDNPHNNRHNDSSLRSESVSDTGHTRVTQSSPSDRTCPSSIYSSCADVEHALSFCHDSTNSTYLHAIRGLVGKSLGSCRLVDASRQHEKVTGFGPSAADSHDPPQKPTPAEADSLVDWCMLATSQMLWAVDAVAIKQDVSQWLQADSETVDLTDAAHYLILAIGALSSPEEEDDCAESYFQYGRQLTMSLSLDTHSILTIQCYIWMTFYLLAACRIEAAADAIGIAGRAAYTLGFNQTEFSDALNEDERTRRGRLWKTLRKLDLFISIAHGRPTATFEVRNVNTMNKYSSVLALSQINENVQVDLYLRPKLSRAFVKDIAEQHRLWVSRFPDGLYEDGIVYTDRCEGVHNLALAYVRGSYRWSIMLLTRPFLLEFVSARISQNEADPPLTENETLHDSLNNAVFAQACVTSAIHAIDLFRATLSSGQIPKRLPFAISLVSAAALTLGIAVFADFDRVFPLAQGLDTGQQLLSHFQSHDITAKFFQTIIGDLQQAQDLYVERRSRRAMASQEKLISKIFGGFPSTHIASAPRACQPWSDLDMAKPPIDRQTHGSDLTLYDFSVIDQQPAVPNRSNTEDDLGLPSAFDIDDIIGMSTPHFLDTYTLDMHPTTTDL